MTSTAPAEIRLPRTWEANLLVALTVVGAVLVDDLSPSLGLRIPELLFIMPTLIWMLLRRYPMRQTLRLEPITGRAALWSALIGLACYPVALGLVALIQLGLKSIWPVPVPDVPLDTPEPIAYAVGLIIVAPITEEPIFQGFVLTAWLRRGFIPGLVLSAFLFASSHLDIVALFPHWLTGVVAAFLVQRTGSLFSSMIAHACYNSLGTLFNVVPDLLAISGWPFVIAGCVALPVALLLLRSFARHYPPLPHTWPAEHTPRIWVVLSLLVMVLLLALVTFVDIFLALNPAAAG